MRSFLLLLLVDGNLFNDLFLLRSIAHLYNICTHVTFAIEYCTWFDLEFACVEITGNSSITAKLQKIFSFYVARNLTDDICLVAGDITFHHTVGTYHHFGGAMDITDNSSVNPEITVAINVTFKSSSGSN